MMKLLATVSMVAGHRPRPGYLEPESIWCWNQYGDFLISPQPRPM